MAQPIFDFVIVGAGSAGCVLAEKLSASGCHSVAIIEAGGSDRRFWIHAPLGYGKTFYDRSVNWAFSAEPDPGLGGRADYWPRGKVLGGSSSINAMVWIRGAREDFDGWERLGNPGWSYADCLPYFKAMEDNAAGADDWRGAGGPMRVSHIAHALHPLSRRFLDAALQAGFAANADFNGVTQEGVGLYQVNTRGGWRLSAAKAFLRPALRRANVTLLPHAHACRVLFDGRRAIGVEIARGGRRENILAREVVLAAGAVGSPHLLQLSGVGPAAQLAALGVAPVLDQPQVGLNMQDHLGINYTYRAKIPSLNQALRPWHGKLRAGLALLLAGNGPLSLSLNQAGGFVRTDPAQARPNMQLYVQALSTLGARRGERPLLTPDPFPGFSLGLSNCRAQSRGSVTTRSLDPISPPAIHANAFAEPDDMAQMLEGVKLLRRLAAQPALSEIIAKELAPGPSAVNDAELVADIRERSGTVYHPCGTCRMGPDPAQAVVDARLRAHGLERLRICDASIFPAIVSGNINAAVMMAAAKGAEMILADAP